MVMSMALRSDLVVVQTDTSTDKHRQAQTSTDKHRQANTYSSKQTNIHIFRGS